VAIYNAPAADIQYPSDESWKSRRFDRQNDGASQLPAGQQMKSVILLNNGGSGYRAA
jgi:hypothetical protein